jgi:hypothetical protein
MIHFLPVPSEADALPEHGELLARVAGLNRALRLVAPFGSGPASDPDERFPELAFALAGPGKRRCFDRRSEKHVNAAAAGLEAVVSGRAAGMEPSDASLRRLAGEIEGALTDLAGVLRH